MFRLSFLLCYFFCTFDSNAQIDPDSCECVPYYQCNDNGTFNTNGENIIDIRLREDDCSVSEVCCKAKSRRSSLRRLDPPKAVGCGYRMDAVAARVTSNDNEAEFGEFPWMVALLMKNASGKYKYTCGGSLIHPKVVLTAAHCVTLNTIGIKIRAGEWDTSTTTLELLPFQERQVSSVVRHKNFVDRRLLSDVALVFLKSPFNITSHVNVVCLPPQNHEELSQECLVTGWGKDKFEGGYQNILKKIEVPIVDREQCQNDFRGTRLGRSFSLDKTFICAGGQEGKDACTGDGGGPLVCPIRGAENRYHQRGIVAWGIGCGQRGVPGAYVDVAQFRGWIDQQMKKMGLDSDVYQY